MSINKRKLSENYNFFIAIGINNATNQDFNEAIINFLTPLSP